MLKIEVVGSEARKSKAGNSYTVQTGFASIPGHKYPLEIEFFPPRGAQPYSPGNYELTAESFVVGDFKKLGFGELHLKPAGK